MRRFSAVAALLLLALAFPGYAQRYPDRALRLVVPDTGGGTLDVPARILAEEMRQVLGQPVLVENKPGAGGILAADSVAKSRPDGYSYLFIPASTETIVPFLYSKLPYDYRKDLIPVTQVATIPLVVFVPASSSIASLKDLTDYAKLRDGKMAAGAYGPGSLGHFSYELLKSRIGLNAIFVPYKGGQQLYGDLLAGNLDILVDTLAGADPFIRSGRIKPLFITSSSRSPLAPNIPTVAESGVPGFGLMGWVGVMAPAETSRAHIAAFQAAAAKALQDTKVRERMAQFSYEATGTSPEALAEIIRADRERYSALVKTLGLRAD